MESSSLLDGKRPRPAPAGFPGSGQRGSGLSVERFLLSVALPFASCRTSSCKQRGSGRREPAGVYHSALSGR